MANQTKNRYASKSKPRRIMNGSGGRNHQSVGPGGDVVRTYDNVDDARAAAALVQGQTSPDNGNMFGEGGGPAGAGEVQPGPDGHYHDSQGRIVSRRTAQEELDRQQGRVRGRKRTDLPTNDVGVNETGYMRRKRGETDFDSIFSRQRGDTHAHLGGFGLGLSAASREGMAEKEFRAENRRRVLESIAANAAEGKQARGDLTRHAQTLQEQQNVARWFGEIDADETAGAMRGALDAARRRLGSTDRKFSSGQGFSAENRKSLGEFAGRMVDTTVDSLSKGIDRNFNPRTDPATAAGRALLDRLHNQAEREVALGKDGALKSAQDWELANGPDLRSDALLPSVKMEAAGRKMNRTGTAYGTGSEFLAATKDFTEAQDDQIRENKEFIATSKEHSAQTKKFLDEHKSWREDTEKEIEELKRRMGQADWGGGVSDRARRFIDRRRGEAKQRLEGLMRQAAYYGGTTAPDGGGQATAHEYDQRADKRAWKLYDAAHRYLLADRDDFDSRQQDRLRALDSMGAGLQRSVEQMRQKWAGKPGYMPGLYDDLSGAIQATRDLGTTLGGAIPGYSSALAQLVKDNRAALVGYENELRQTRAGGRKGLING